MKKYHLMLVEDVEKIQNRFSRMRRSAFVGAGLVDNPAHEAFEEGRRAVLSKGHIIELDRGLASEFIERCKNGKESNI